MPQRPPSLADIEALAKRALADLPHQFKDRLGPVVIRVDEFPDPETEAAMRLDSPFDLLGLYRGVALPLKSVSAEDLVRDIAPLYQKLSGKSAKDIIEISGNSVSALACGVADNSS